MRRAALLGLALAICACSGGPSQFRSAPEPEPVVDELYWKALFQLDAANKKGSLDSASVFLDAYLAKGTSQPHRREAMVLRQLTRDSRQLARVEGALQQARADTSSRPHTEAETKRRDEEAVKEIQRLKEELAKANEELERIRKRLTAPKTPDER